MRDSKTGAGFSVIEALLIVVAIGIISFVGLKVYDTKTTVDSTAASTASQELVATNRSPKTSAPQIKSNKDLDEAQKTMDQNDPSVSGSSDSTALDSQLDF